jgi:hypothetical protein
VFALQQILGHTTLEKVNRNGVHQNPCCL